jgi:hypothetical protein
MYPIADYARLGVRRALRGARRYVVRRIYASSRKRIPFRSGCEESR